MTLDVRFVGDTALVANLKGMGAAVTRAGTDSIKRSTLKVLRLAKKKAPIGNPSRGDKHPDTLQRAINSRFVDGGPLFAGVVGIRLTYAAAHEFGCHKVVSVPAHLRMQTMAWGKKLKDPHQVSVRTHSMKMNITERSYLRAALKDLKADIVVDLRASVMKAVKE